MTDPPTPPEYLGADEYMRRTGLPYKGRWLQRRCDENEDLARLIGEFRTSGRRVYTAETAGRFRDLYYAAVRR